MEERNVYRDISRRTDGDVYIGVVGPVRTGKSTFIKKFMDSLVLPNITDEAVYRRTLDELPQSASGRTIMTTEPKFIPEESVEVDLGNNTSFRVRMIDCVGYIVKTNSREWLKRLGSIRKFLLMTLPKSAPKRLLQIIRQSAW